MKTVKIRREEMREVVQKNRDEHRAVFEATLAKYHAAVIQELEKSLADAKAGKRYRHMIRLEEPQDQTKDYTRILLMLDMSTEDVIELSEAEFRQYIQDDWSWKGQFTLTASNYGVKSPGYDD